MLRCAVAKRGAQQAAVAGPHRAEVWGHVGVKCEAAWEGSVGPCRGAVRGGEGALSGNT